MTIESASPRTLSRRPPIGWLPGVTARDLFQRETSAPIIPLPPSPLATQNPSPPPPEPVGFFEFLTHVYIESDDAKHPGPVRFNLFGYQARRAIWWAKRRSEVVLKPRQMGFSWLLAALKVWTSGCHEAWHSAVFSRRLREAKKQLWRCAYIVDHYAAPELLSPYASKSTEQIEFANGSTIIAFPSTEDVGISYTFQLVVADEGAFHPYGSANYAAYFPAIAPGGQFILNSTANPKLGPNGFFYDMWEDAQCTLPHSHAPFEGSLGLEPREDCESPSGLRAVFIHWSERPGRDEEWRAEQKRRLRRQADSFDAFYPDTPEAAFVGKEGLVFPQFNPMRHVRVGDPCKWEECIQRYAAYDLGGGDPSAAVKLGTYRRSDGQVALHQFAEWYKQDGAPTVEQVAEPLNQWHGQARLTSVEPDPAPLGATIALSLHKVHSLPVRLVKLRGEENQLLGKADRLNTHAWWLDSGLFTINADCRHSIREYAGYRWTERTDPNSKDRYQTSTPVDHHGDAIDARGLAMLPAYFELLRQPKPAAKRRVRYA